MGNLGKIIYGIFIVAVVLLSWLEAGFFRRKKRNGTDLFWRLSRFPY